MKIRYDAGKSKKPSTRSHMSKFKLKDNKGKIELKNLIGNMCSK